MFVNPKWSYNSSIKENPASSIVFDWAIAYSAFECYIYYEKNPIT